MDKNDKTVVKFNNVTKRYKLFKNDKKRLLAAFFPSIKSKEKLAINEVSMEIKQGESVALLGKNGAGKSTMLKMITGVAFPTTGEVEVNGRVSALLELTSGFDPQLSGRDNIKLKGQLMGVPDDEIKRIEPLILEFADIDQYIDQPVRSYSSGMKARLGFGINVNIDPEILIVDEALSVGDKEFRKKCKKKVGELLSTGNVTLLFVTHATSVAKEFCDRGIVMEKGKIVFDSTIDEAIAYYGRD